VSPKVVFAPTIEETDEKLQAIAALEMVSGAELDP
jgi:hypothetical protein